MVTPEQIDGFLATVEVLVNIHHDLSTADEQIQGQRRELQFIVLQRPGWLFYLGLPDFFEGLDPRDEKLIFAYMQRFGDGVRALEAQLNERQDGLGTWKGRAAWLFRDDSEAKALGSLLKTAERLNKIFNDRATLWMVKSARERRPPRQHVESDHESDDGSSGSDESDESDGSYGSDNSDDRGGSDGNDGSYSSDNSDDSGGSYGSDDSDSDDGDDASHDAGHKLLWEAFDICDSWFGVEPQQDIIRNIRTCICPCRETNNVEVGALWRFHLPDPPGDRAMSLVSLLGRRMLQGLRLCSVSRNPVSGPKEDICRKAAVVLPRQDDHECYSDTPVVLACVCGKHQLRYCVTGCIEVLAIRSVYVVVNCLEVNQSGSTASSIGIRCNDEQRQSLGFAIQ
ncbi:hypothetical protein NHJ6243_005444 [Beauveria neobassiana]